MPFYKGHKTWNKGKRLSKEIRKRMSNAKKGIPSKLIGIPRTKEVRDKISKAHLGKKLSKAHKRKLSLQRRGVDNVRWKGGRIKINGYILLRQDINVYKLEHRVVIEKYLDRKLKIWEQVHHKNGRKDDNRIENLTIVLRKKHYGKIRCPYCLKNFLIK